MNAGRRVESHRCCMSKKWGLGIFAAAAFASVVRWVDPFLVMLLAVGICGVSLLVAAVVGVFYLAALRGERETSMQVGILKVVAGCAGFAVLAIPCNRWVQEWAVVDAKEFPERVAPMLEEHRAKHGRYPGSLSELSVKPAVPRLLRSEYGYRSDGRAYSFAFGQPGGLIDVWTYSSGTRRWHFST